MDKKSMVFFVVMMAMMFLIMKQFGGAQKQVIVKPTTIADAQTLEKAAGDDQAKLKKVVDAYNQVAKENPNTETEAQAHLRIAIIEETKLDNEPFGLWVTLGFTKKVPGEKQETIAVASYKTLVANFPPETSAAGKEAQERMIALEKKIDEKSAQGLGYRAIDSLVALTGRNPKWSFAIALLIITIIIKVVTTPLSRKQYQSMKEMQKIGPLVKQIQEKYKGDQQKIGEQTMALYKEHGVNPFASCLPLVIQMPVLIGLYYKVILAYQYQFAKGHFLWIGSHYAQSLPATFKVTLVGKTFIIPLLARNLSTPDIILLVLYTASMVISQKLTVVDPAQAEQQKMMAWMMPLMFAFIFASFPSALMLYWLMFNIFSTAQQYMIMKPGLATAGGPALEAIPAEKAPIPSKVTKKKKK